MSVGGTASGPVCEVRDGWFSLVLRVLIVGQHSITVSKKRRLGFQVDPEYCLLKAFPTYDFLTVRRVSNRILNWQSHAASDVYLCCACRQKLLLNIKITYTVKDTLIARNE